MKDWTKNSEWTEIIESNEEATTNNNNNSQIERRMKEEA